MAARTRPAAPPPTAAPRPERRRSTDVAAAEIEKLDSTIQQQDETWKAALHDLENRLENVWARRFAEFKTFITDTLKAFTDANALTEDQKTYLKTHTVVWHAETEHEVRQRRAAYERTVKFVDGEEAHRAEMAEAARAAADQIAADLAHDRRIAQRRWKVAGQLAAIIIPALLSLLGGVFISQFQRLNTISPGAIVLFGGATVALIAIVFGVATYKLSGEDSPDAPRMEGKKP